MKSVTLTREELHRLVWSEPTTKVAARYELSDQGLKKICLKHRIPVPGRGYWQKLANGGKVAAVALPKLAREEPIIIHVRPKPARAEKESDEEQAPEPAIEVPETLDRPHPITRALRDELKRSRTDDYGAIHSIGPDGFAVRIHPSSTDRALRIVDAFVKGCTARGFGFAAGKNGARIGGQMRVVVNGEEMEFTLEEKMRRETHKLTDEEIARRKRGHFVYSRTYDFVPTGTLTIKIGPAYGSGLQSSWADTRHQRLEGRLADVIVGMRALAQWRKGDRRKTQEREARFQEVVRTRQELRGRVEAEKRAVAELEQDAERWRRAEAIRAYVAAARTAADPKDEQRPEWLDWALRQADRLDPLSESPPSILDTPETEMQPMALWQYRDHFET